MRKSCNSTHIRNPLIFQGKSLLLHVCTGQQVRALILRAGTSSDLLTLVSYHFFYKNAWKTIRTTRLGSRETLRAVLPKKSLEREEKRKKMGRGENLRAVLPKKSLEREEKRRKMGRGENLRAVLPSNIFGRSVLGHMGNKVH